MLQVNDVHTYYGESHVLQGISLEVPTGSVVGVLGRNGMGKTTLTHSIIGFLNPRKGSVIFQGEEVTRLRPHHLIQRGMALVPQGRRIFPSLSVHENLMLGAKENGRTDGASDPWTLERVLTLFPRLKERLKNMGNNLSGGEQQMLAIARALMTNPRLLLLDEPTEGLAPLLVRTLGDVILQLKESRLSILLVEQNMKFALSICEQVHIMSRGQVVYSSSTEELNRNEEVKTRFIGI
ncbi:MAG: ABC transporter ATP-binding protein [bacterium]|nr:ABC transporter ATP-binding protein [bacterium]